METNNKIALCVFATGKYMEFLDGLVKSVRKHFNPSMPVDIVTFTDTKPAPELSNIAFKIPHLKWPYGTLLRYRFIRDATDVLSNYSYVYMCDADMRFVDNVGQEVVGKLVGAVHRGHMNKSANDLPNTSNKKSTAYITKRIRPVYYAGGFQGGAGNKYLAACTAMANNIARDEQHGIMADWHDESHWNAYLARHITTVDLGPPYCWGEPDGCPPGTKILALAKNHDEYRDSGSSPTSNDRAEPWETQANTEEEKPEMNTELGKCITEVSKTQMRQPYKNQILEILEQCNHVYSRMHTKVYSDGAQGDLEAVINSLLPQDPVVYVDVGASDPVDCSNTWTFYKSGGHGLLIEPRTDCWPAILTKRPRDILWPKAITAKEGFAQLYLCGGCSSLNEEWTAEKRGQITVMTEPLSSVMARFPEIRDSASILSIDTEGSECEVLKSNNWEQFSPPVVVVEYYVYERPEGSDERAESICQIMTPLGYVKHHQDRLNIVFVKENTYE
jgi:histo-blood group ABO system transferase